MEGAFDDPRLQTTRPSIFHKAVKYTNQHPEDGVVDFRRAAVGDEHVCLVVDSPANWRSHPV